MGSRTRPDAGASGEIRAARSRGLMRATKGPAAGDITAKCNLWDMPASMPPGYLKAGWSDGGKGAGHDTLTDPKSRYPRRRTARRHNWEPDRVAGQAQR